MIKNRLFFLVFMSLMCSCHNTFDTVEELNTYVDDENNGYRYSKTVNGVDYVLQYRPTDLMVMQEAGDTVNEDKIEEIRLKYGKYMYFNLSMSKGNNELLSTIVQDKQKFGSMVHDLAFEMGQKIHLVSPKKDTVEMIDFVYPRMYGMTNSTTIMVVYPRHEKLLEVEYLELTVEDLGLDTGDIRFKLNAMAFRQEPKLRFKK